MVDQTFSFTSKLIVAPHTLAIRFHKCTALTPLKYEGVHPYEPFHQSINQSSINQSINQSQGCAACCVSVGMPLAHEPSNSKTLTSVPAIPTALVPFMAGLERRLRSLTCIARRRIFGHAFGLRNSNFGPHAFMLLVARPLLIPFSPVFRLEETTEHIAQD
mmetsp:Transcript_34193/g.56617  ORF Transcript_34193/g.56617 Transcript_34193/m.56617 type:complete len:161 (+) Transcript_34193:50-532(+)